MTFKEFICEMAYPQSKAIEKIEDLLPQLSVHILKCHIMETSRDYNHWKNEILNWLIQISAFARVKTPKQTIKYEVFIKEYDHIWRERFINNMLDSICEQYDISRDVGDTEHFCAVLEHFYKTLFKKLSENSFNLNEMRRLLPR